MFQIEEFPNGGKEKNTWDPETEIVLPVSDSAHGSGRTPHSLWLTLHSYHVE